MKVYQSDLSDKQWDFVRPFLGESKKRKVDTRAVFNAILYVIKTGCQWRQLPKDFPNYQTVFYYFNSWKHRGVFQKPSMSTSRFFREGAGRDGEPTAAIIDPQSIKATLVSTGGQTGFDAGKKIKGVKRHIAVDSMGMLPSVVVHSAGVQDRDGLLLVLPKLARYWQKIVKVFADGGYQGEMLAQKVKDGFNYILEVIKRNEVGVFKVLPKRWVVERTFSWIDTNRRNAKSYERYTNTVEAVTHLAFVRTLLNRLDKKH